VFNASGNVVELAAHTFGFNNYTPMGISSSKQRLLIEEQRTNVVPNPRIEGTDGVNPPTSWGTITGSGLTVAPAFTTLLNFRALRTRLNGTASGTPVSWPYTGPTQGASIAPSQKFVYSGFFRMQDATTPPTGPFQFRAGYKTSADSPVGTSPTINTNITIPTTTLTRQIGYGTASTDVTTAKIVPQIVQGVTASSPYDFTLDQLLPQVEITSSVDLTFPTSPILPVAGTPGASTRNADVVTVSNSILNAGAGTFVWKGMIPYLPPAGKLHTLFSVSDATANNAYQIAVNSTGNVVFIANAAGAGAVTATTATAITAGVDFRVAAAYTTTTVSVTLNGGAVATASMGSLVGTLRFDIGSLFGTGSFTNGEHEYLDYFASLIPSSAALQALCTGIP
jgi:hypothetical protein